MNVALNSAEERGGWIGAILLCSILATVLAYVVLIKLLDYYIMQSYVYARIVTTTVFAAGLLFCWLSAPKVFYPLTLPFMCHFGLVMAGTIVGVLSRAPTVYVVANTVYLVFQAGAFRLLCRRDLAINELESIARFFDHGVRYVCIALILAGAFGLFIPHEIRPLMVCGIVWGCLRRKWGIAVLSAAAIGVAAENLTRSFMLQCVVVAPVVLVAVRENIKAIGGILTLTAVMVLALVLAFKAGAFEGTQLERRIQQTLLESEGSERTIPIDQRIYEMRVVLQKFRQSPEWRLATGFGTGAVVDLSGTEDRSVRGSQVLDVARVHNIHFLLFAVLYRYGVIGVVWLGMLIGVVFLLFLKAAIEFPRLPDRVATVKLVCLLYCVMNIVDGFFASSHLLSNVLFGAFLAFGFSVRLNYLLVERRADVSLEY